MKKILKRNKGFTLVECIVAMPTQLFYTTQIPVSLWFLSKNKKQKGGLRFHEKSCYQQSLF